MPEKSSFEGLFDDRLNSMPQVIERNETAKPAAQKAKPGREVGKRSNPAYKQFSVLLKKETQMEVSHTLDRSGSGHDVSDLVQQLLEQWLKRQQKKTEV